MKNLILSFMLIVSASFVNAQTTAGNVLTNSGIVEMHKAGLSKEVILSSIDNTSIFKFNVSPAGLVALKKAGVDDSVIKQMIEKQAGNQTSKVAAMSTGGGRPEAATSSISAGTGMALPLLNHVYYSHSSSKAQPLEKSVAGVRTKSGPIVSKVLYQVDGAKSSVRINGGSETSFLINTGNEMLPELVLYSINALKDKREVVTMTASPAGVKTGASVITTNITKVRNGVFKVTPGKTLDKGEYFFTGKPVQGSSSADAFTFGID